MREVWCLVDVPCSNKDSRNPLLERQPPFYAVEKQSGSRKSECKRRKEIGITSRESGEWEDNFIYEYMQPVSSVTTVIL